MKKKINRACNLIIFSGPSFEYSGHILFCHFIFWIILRICSYAPLNEKKKKKSVRILLCFYAAQVPTNEYYIATK